MKHLFLVALLFSYPALFSQTRLQVPTNATTVECESREEREAYKLELKKAKAEFYLTNRDAMYNRNTEAHPLLAWPMRLSNGKEFAVYNYFNLQNYVDQISNSSYFDYRCNQRTYDGHDAADINLWPFWWHMMDNNYVSAVAAANGTIIFKRDGNDDRNCSQSGSANSITILHADGSTTRYLHLKKNSLTSKEENDPVTEGEFLGYIGSSGRSSNPHLHFAVYDADDNLIEPFYNAAASNCNVYNEETWWQNQRSYWEPQINRVMTHSTPPDIDFCPGDENINIKNNFSINDFIYTGIAFQDGQDEDEAFCQLLKPNGDELEAWTVTLNTTNSRIYATTSHFPTGGDAGTWLFRVNYRGRIYKHYFSVGCVNSETASGTIPGDDAHIVGGHITSTAIHQGTINPKVVYQAGSYVDLKPGCHIQAGVNFKAWIKPCSYTE